MNRKPQDSRPDLQEWENAINALMDGELDDREAEQLKAAATDDLALARAIIEAYQLQQALANIPRERAPASLRRKLADIPRQQAAIQGAGRRNTWLQPRWVAAFAVIPLAIMVTFIGISLNGPKEPSPAEIAKAQQELAVALAYLGKVSRKTSHEIGSTVSTEMEQAVNENMIRTLQDQMEFRKERKA